MIMTDSGWAKVRSDGTWDYDVAQPSEADLYAYNYGGEVTMAGSNEDTVIDSGFMKVTIPQNETTKFGSYKIENGEIVGIPYDNKNVEPKQNDNTSERNTHENRNLLGFGESISNLGEGFKKLWDRFSDTTVGKIVNDWIIDPVVNAAQNVGSFLNDWVIKPIKNTYNDAKQWLADSAVGKYFNLGKKDLENFKKEYPTLYTNIKGIGKEAGKLIWDETKRKYKNRDKSADERDNINSWNNPEKNYNFEWKFEAPLQNEEDYKKKK